MVFTSLLDKVVHLIASCSGSGAHGHSHGPENLACPSNQGHPASPERPECCRNVVDGIRNECAGVHKHSPSMDQLGAGPPHPRRALESVPPLNVPWWAWLCAVTEGEVAAPTSIEMVEAGGVEDASHAKRSGELAG
jgi:hypothetical protein